ncbi:MarR family winged helix-turn-helix transcriptional regulator [Microbacterium sp. 22242]|uniref:MarR family winged helix-turn-helix transcriptional regulator n=1 Tax=Microbacterium sp. 22242 TaxID=3453896 RepID=UPI003F87592C
MRAFHAAGRDLIGIALRSLDVAGDELSLPKFRMLLALNDLGRAPSTRVAHALAVNASSVTRLADRLVHEGYVTRGSDEHSRSVVTLELSQAGRRLVDRVLAWRHEELGRLLAGLDPELRSATTAGLEQFAETAAASYSSGFPGPVAL